MSNEPSDFLEETPEREPAKSGQHAKRPASHAASAHRSSGDPHRDPSRRNPPPHKKKKRRRKKKKTRTGLVILITVLAVLAVLALAGYLVFMHFYGMLNTGSKSVAPVAATAAPTAAVEVVDTPAEVTPEPTLEPTPTPEPLTEEELAELAEMELRSSLQEDAEEIMYNENVYNILLIGSDGLSDALERSDSMNLVSINKETGKIWVTSLMRDTQVTLPNYGLTHLNWTTSIGGIDALISAIESERNFAIHIDNWAMVNFLDFVKVADLLGPITVTVTNNEAYSMNQNIRQVCQMIDAAAGREADDPNNVPRCYFPSGGGTYTITDGAQILGYCRERYVGGDTGRSEKQRNALTQMWNNLKNMTLTEQYELAKTVLPIVTTNMTPGQCFSLLLQLPSIANYEVHTQQSPIAGAFWKGRDQNNLSIYNADFTVNRRVLRATIYGERFTAAELTSSWTGVSQLVYWDDSWN